MTSIETAPRCIMRTRLYRDGSVALRDFPASEISEHLDEHDGVVWLDLESPTAADLAVITEELGLHPLAVEDALHPHQRPKLDVYESHLFLTAYLAKIDSDYEMSTIEVNAFITDRAFVTVHSEAVDWDDIERRWNNMFRVAGDEVGCLVHGLIDHAVDGYFNIVQGLDENLDGLEDMLFDDRIAGKDVQRESFQARKSLVTLRRIVLPTRELLSTLMRRDMVAATPALVPYYQDVFDHVLRVTEWTESLRDLVSTILDTNLNIQSNRLNEVMRKLTAWAAIFAVPTAITGYFGQNVPYPGAQHWSGFVASTVSVVALSVFLWAMFTVKRWL